MYLFQNPRGTTVYDVGTSNMIILVTLTCVIIKLSLGS